MAWRLSAAALVGLSMTLTASAQEQGPFPEPGTDAWKTLFAVDPADDPMGESPFDIGQGTSYQTTLKGQLAGFDVGRVFLTVTVSDTGYSVDYQMEQRGVARWFSDGEAKANASGLFGEDGQIATHYYYNHDYDGEEKQQRTELFREAGSERLHLWSLPAYKFRQPVSVAEAENAVDPLAALVALAFAPVPHGMPPCERRVPVLDGKRRFDLVMIPDGKEDVRRNGPGRYSGPAIKCKLEQHKIAGYKEKNRGDVEGDMWVYLAEVPEEMRGPHLRYVPVKIVARQGIIGASLQAKKPKLVKADGTESKLH
ncbi:MAG: DUF3108 domain-containing protein [Parvularculaceae bacterium]|nr:DUF3108 domain-containing protein [Parvularculaceae bacterium]